MSPLNLYFDGGCQPGVGVSYGFVLKDQHDKIVTKFGRALKDKRLTSNQAEYLGLIFALTWCLAHGHRRVKVFGDSLLIVNQMTGEFKVKDEKLTPLHESASLLSETFEQFSIEWIPREENEEADRETRGN